jgi:N-acetylmuramoyl-L-alanine amidase
LFWETIWDHPDNQALRELREDPFALAVGDQVFIPDLTLKSSSCGLDQLHRFRRRGVPAKLRLQLLDELGEPRASSSYRLTVDRKLVAERTTDAEGWIEEWIDPRARRAVLTIEDEAGVIEELELQLGHLQAINTIAGVKGRLRNLGYLTGPVDDEADEQLAAAVHDFQADHELDGFGVLDDATRDELVRVYGE